MRKYSRYPTVPFGKRFDLIEAARQLAAEIKEKYIPKRTEATEDDDDLTVDEDGVVIEKK